MRFLGILSIIVSSWTFASPFFHATLPNGLKIHMKEDHRSHAAIVMMWYDVGSSDDPHGQTGLAHVLEHLMFKGTPKTPGDTFSKTIAAIGGQDNAFTTQDYTVYFEKIAAADMPRILTLEADRMTNLTFDEETFTKEMKVIQEERRLRVEDHPQSLAFERFLATAHLTTPYHQPVIGWMNDLKHLTRSDVMTYYRAHYGPNNAHLILVGDIVPNKLMPIITSTFGAIPSIATPARKPQLEPPPLGRKTVEIHIKKTLPMLLRGYLIPSFQTNPTSHTPYALEIIATLLDMGDHGRLQKRLIHDTSCASAVGIQYDPYTRYDTTWVIYARPTPSCSLPTLQQMLDHEITQLQTTNVSAHELARVKTTLIASKTFEQDTLMNQAMFLGLTKTQAQVSDPLLTYRQSIEAITPALIQSTAKRYLQKQRITEAYLMPEGGFPR